jgi:hypothetical protein
MRKILVSLFLGIFTSACDRSGAQGTPWPEISFVVLDEIPDKFVFSRTKDFVPSVNRVVLLPIVENYLWNGKRYYLALADPIIVEPGRETLRKTMSSLETGDQVVRECVVLARGYCPGTLQPVINYAGSYNGKTNWLVELAKVSDFQFENAFQSITNELTSSALRIGKEKTFEVAIKEKALLRTGELLSPVIRNDGFRSRYVLWSVPVGTEVAICLSSNAIKSLKNELLGLVTDP